MVSHSFIEEYSMFFWYFFGKASVNYCDGFWRGVSVFVAFGALEVVDGHWR